MIALLRRKVPVMLLVRTALPSGMPLNVSASGRERVRQLIDGDVSRLYDSDPRE